MQESSSPSHRLPGLGCALLALSLAVAGVLLILRQRRAELAAAFPGLLPAAESAIDLSASPPATAGPPWTPGWPKATA